MSICEKSLHTLTCEDGRPDWDQNHLEEKKKSLDGNEDWADKAKNFSSSNDWTFLNPFIWSDGRARSEVQKEEQSGKEGATRTAENRNGFEGFRSVSSVEEAFRPLDQFSADMSYKDEANLNLSDDGENMTHPGTNQSQLTQCKCNVSFIFMILRK